MLHLVELQRLFIVIGLKQVVYTMSYSSNGDNRAVTLTNGATTMTWTTGLSSTPSNDVSIFVKFTDNGTPTTTMTDLANPVPIGNSTNFLFTGMYSGSTVFTITSYVDPTGTNSD